MKKFLSLALVLALSVAFVGCNSVKEDVYDDSLSNEDAEVVETTDETKEDAEEVSEEVEKTEETEKTTEEVAE